MGQAESACLARAGPSHGRAGLGHSASNCLALAPWLLVRTASLLVMPPGQPLLAREALWRGGQPAKPSGWAVFQAAAMHVQTADSVASAGPELPRMCADT